MPGRRTRRKSVLVPIRGEGTCEDPDGPGRHEDEVCNDHPCNNDEICIAHQDLIIAIDGSGSLKEDGFETIRDFAVNLTGRYEPKYYGVDTVQIGVILFGNGKRLEDGTIQPAVNVIGLTADLAAVKEKVKATTWQKGFTNMAQAFALADTMFQLGGRASAQSALLVLSDGKYSFAFETEQAVNKLKEKNTMIFMAPISSTEGEWQHKIKSWASQPWETNYEYLPGLKAVKYNMDTYAAVLIAKFCSDAISPIGELQKNRAVGYMMIHEGGFPTDDCGPWSDLGYVESIGDCATAAKGDSQEAFSIAPPDWQGKQHCYGEAIKVSGEDWKKWEQGPQDIPCEGGAWIPNPNYDVYAVEPMDLA